MGLFDDRVYFIFKATPFDAQAEQDRTEQKLKMIQTQTEPFRETVSGVNPRLYVAKSTVEDWPDLFALFPDGLLEEYGTYEYISPIIDTEDWSPPAP